MDSSEIDRLFDKMRKAGHGRLIKFDPSGSGQQIEGIILEPSPRRPSGFESGIFVVVPTDKDNLYYFNPEASKEQGRIIIQKIDLKKSKEPEPPPSDDSLAEFEYLEKAPDVKIGGGAVGESFSKYVKILDIGT